MCGFAGFFGSKLISKEKLIEVGKTIEHRGPDGEGIFQHKFKGGQSISLVHRRLAIIDLDNRSNQPFFFNNKVIVFNGEIYNYLEIKKELITLGHKFQTDGDTEVLIKSLTQWGNEAFSKFEGMWAFAFYDLNTGELTLSRDPFSEKPLYYFQNSDGIYFASEPKAIFKFIGFNLEINFKHIKNYLVGGYKSLWKFNSTFFEDLNQIEAGHFCIIDRYKDKKSIDYRNWNFDSQNISLNYKDSVEMVREALINSIKIRMRSDVPIAFCLSGGIDSNALVSLAKEFVTKEIHGFSIINTDERYDERDYIKHSVNQLEIKHTEIKISKKNFLQRLRQQILKHDAPICTINYFAHWQLMEKISQSGYKVSISGTGADEIFSGYMDHHLAYLKVMYDLDKKRFKEAKDDWEKIILPFVRNPYLKNYDYFIKNQFARKHITLESDKFESFLKEDFNYEFREDFYSKDFLRNRMYNELFHEIVPVILNEDDLNAMDFSIENRSPFLDQNLFNLAQNIPTRHLIKNGLAKTLLRDAVSGYAPKKIINNPKKIGFNIPLYDYLDINNKNTKEQILSDSPIYSLVKKEQIENLFNLDFLPNSISKFLFNFICSKIFLEEF